MFSGRRHNGFTNNILQEGVLLLYVSARGSITCIFQVRVTHDPGFERGFQLSAVQLLPVDVAEEGVGSHGVLPPLCSHAAQTPGRVLGQELKRQQKYQIIYQDSYHV